MPKTVETRVGVCYNDFKYCTKGETGMLISLVVPCYNEEESLPIFYKEASKIAQQMGISHGADFEFIFVDDGSKDRTLQIARELHRKDARVRYISFSRNFGKEAGIYAGLKAAKGDYVATMDADLQDPPSLLPEMLELLLSGESPKSGDERKKLLEQACAYLGGDFRRNDDLRGFCRRHGCGYENFRKFFKAELGISPHRYRIRRRLDAACALLSDPGLSIASIAERLGYSSPYEFSAQFKRHMGCAPSEYLPRFKN